MTDAERFLHNKKKVAGLHPSVQPLVNAFLEKTEEPFKLRITHGLRTFAEQNALYAKGRTEPGGIVTNAKGGESFHNFGLAIDVYSETMGYSIDWDELEKIATSVGLEHGDRGFKDLPHFQYRGGLSLQEVQAGARPAIQAEPINHSTEEDMSLRIHREQYLVYVYDSVKNENRLWVIKKHDVHPLETRHAVKPRHYGLLAELFGRAGLVKEMKSEELMGLTRGERYNPNREAALHPWLFEPANS